MPNIYEILASLDAARRTARRNIGDMVNDPRGYADKMLGHMQNQNAGVAPVAAGGQLTNRPLTLAERADQAINSVDFGGGLGKIAYHGSPHKFDRFNAAKMGTGEGAQAYGKGMYLAEAPEVAQSYVTLGHKQGNVAKIDGKPLYDKYKELENKANRMPYDQARPIYDQMEILESLMGNSTVEQATQYARPAAADWFKKDMAHTYEPSGHFYKTDIPDQAVEKFLDWDKPLHQQHPDVQAAVKRLGVSPVGVDQAAVEAAKARFNQTQSRSDLEEMHRLMNAGRQPMGSELVRGSFLKGLSDANGVVLSPEQALASKGIPGIRYLDAGSRDSVAGTSNFVAFDPDIIRILERNGEATGAAPWTPEEYAAYLRSKGR